MRPSPGVTFLQRRWMSVLQAVWTFLVTQAVVLAIVFLSISVITGFAGHISLAQGAFAATGAFSLFHKIFLEGEIFGWLLRSEDRIPGFLPVDPKWMMIMFGLGTIQYAKHPEGVIDMTRAKNADKRAKRAAKRAAKADRAASSTPSERTDEAAKEPVG